MQRLDKLLVEKGLFSSRERAQDAINQKTIAIHGQIVDKPSKLVDENTEITVIDIFNKYVSRGGLKLEKAIEIFGIDFKGKTVLDIGASTGGFTDCALQHGAKFVTSIDVGTQQLHPSLQNHPQVHSMENKDFRDLQPTEITPSTYDFIVSDASFISLSYLIPHFKPFLKPDSRCILLIKPQFEAGASFLNKSGIVTDEKGYKIAIQRVTQEAINYGFYLNQIGISTLFEKVKNVEFLALFSYQNTHFSIDYNTLFKDIKKIKKQLS